MHTPSYLEIIKKYITPESPTYPLYMIHVTMVTARALRIARKTGLSPQQITFIEEAAMLHDIGISGVDCADLGTHGGPYITHGVLGAQILQKEGLPQHARVAESHTGVGIYRDEITSRNLPLPHRDFVPQTLEERIISYADLFYSKHPQKMFHEKTLDEVRAWVAKFGSRHAATLEQWIHEFEK